MWDKLSSLILKFRFLIVLLVSALTLFVAQHALNVEFSVERAKILPSTHEEFINYKKFQKKYGENHVMAIAISDPDFFTIERFKYWDQLCDKIDNIDGVNNIISVNRLSSLEKNSEEKKFGINPWFQ